MPNGSNPTDRHAFSPYGYMRCRQLEGTYPQDAGCWTTTLYRVMCGWGMVNPSDWNDSNRLNPIEPPNIDQIAKKHRIGHYYRVRSSEDAKRILKRKLPVQAAFEVTKQWAHAVAGRIENIPEFVTPQHSHSVVFEDYLEDQNFLRFWNNWGPFWGVGGYGYMREDYFDRWQIDALVPFVQETYKKIYVNKGVQTSKVMIDDFADTQLIFATIYSPNNNEKIGWSTSSRRDGFFDVEELYVRPQYRGKGYGRYLTLEIKSLAEEYKLPIRLWIPYVDSYHENHPTLVDLASKLGLRIEKTNVTWAGYVAIPGRTLKRLPIIRIPARPKSTQKDLIFSKEPIEPKFSAEMEDELWALRGRMTNARRATEGE